MNQRLIAPLFTLALIITCGCNESSQDTTETENPTFAFVTNNVSNFWTIAHKGLDKAKSELPIEVVYRTPSDGSVNEQQRIIEDLLNQGVDGIAVSPIDGVNQAGFLARAAAEVPLICFDSDSSESKRLAYVGTVNYQAGREAGKLIKEALPEGGKAMLFVGTLDAQNAIDRRQGILDELADSNVEVIDTMTDQVDTTRARANAEDAIVTYADLNCLVGLWSYNGPALVEAVRGTGRQDIRIVCFDEDDLTLQGIQDGLIHGSVIQKPFEMGYQTMRLLYAIHTEQPQAVPENGILDTGIVVVRKDNVDDFWADLKSMLE